MTRKEMVVGLSDNHWLAVVVDEPPTAPVGTIIVCHGLTGDRSGPQNLLSGLSKCLVNRSLRVVRFDFRGSGDSSGEFADTTFSTMMEDFRSIHSIVHPTDAVGVLGLSIGGVVAALGAVEIKATALALVSSDIIEGIKFGAGGRVAIREGHFYLNGQFWKERESMYPRQAFNDHPSMDKVLYYGGMDDKVKLAAAELADYGVRSVEFQGADHLFETSEARRKLGESVGHFFKTSFEKTRCSV